MRGRLPTTQGKFAHAQCIALNTDGANCAIVRSTITASTTNSKILVEVIRIVIIQCGGSPDPASQ
jgi:hypothetical protein